LTQAVAYLRASSSVNIGADKDSDQHQRDAITAFAKRARFTIVEEFYDAAVSGADPIEIRRGFAAMLERIESNGVRAVLVEDASRFASDLVTQELGLLILIKHGVRVLTAAGDDLTDSSDPARVMMRQIADAFAQYEKARLIIRLKRARDLKRARTGKKVGGRSSHALRNLALVAEARKLARRLPKGGQRSLREIAVLLEQRGYLNERGVRFSADSVRSILRRR
jgi:DNA invertase Pin-like site-specific DNA recombinase